MKKGGALLLFPLLLSLAACDNQSNSKVYTISGIISTNDGGSPLGATVQLRKDNQVTPSVKTDVNGAYTIAGIPLGVYTLKASLFGYKEVETSYFAVESDVILSTAPLERKNPALVVDDLEDFIESIEKLEINLKDTSQGQEIDEPVSIRVESLLTGQQWEILLGKIDESPVNFVSLDLADCTLDETSQFFAPEWSVSDKIVALILPDEADLLNCIPGNTYINDKNVERERFINLQTIRGNNIETIGDNVFLDYTSLKEIAFPKLTSIGGTAFSGCTSLTGTGGLLKVTDIGTAAFSGCTSLTAVALAAERIGRSAFSGCTGLTTVKLEPYDTAQESKIGPYAFSDCTSLTTVTLVPKSILLQEYMEIGPYAFFNAESLASLTLGTIPPIVSIGAFTGSTPGNFTIYRPSGSSVNYDNWWDEVKGSCFNSDSTNGPFKDSQD